MVPDDYKEPGYKFTNYRFKKLFCEISDAVPSDSVVDNATVAKLNYDDSYTINGSQLVVKQSGTVILNSESNPDLQQLRVEVVLEAIFTYDKSPNISPESFADEYAPAILFPYLREAVSRLTSNVAPFGPVLIPPTNMNLLKLPTSKVEENLSEQSKEKGE